MVSKRITGLDYTHISKGVSTKIGYIFIQTLDITDIRASHYWRCVETLVTGNSVQVLCLKKRKKKKNVMIDQEG